MPRQAEDDELELAVRRICDGANFYIVMADKKRNSEGLQPANLTARPIGLSVLRPGQRNRAFEALNAKYHRKGGVLSGIGLKSFP
jgi:hypothetical protein